MKRHYKHHFLFLLIGVFLCTTGWAQERTVTGKVLDASDQSVLPGVTVLEEGTNNGTVTDTNGAFSLSVGEQAVLVFSFVGYDRLHLAVEGQSDLTVTLTPNIQQLSEIVVVGYGTQKKEDLTGSVSVISTEDFNKGYVPTPEQLIVGKVPGVSITSNGGAPGSGSRIRIRGGASLNASNDPLIVVDGVPLATSGISGASNPLSFINPNDIETINILKDASATAIYGSRASNGVIIITTKKGKEGQPFRAEFSTLHSISTVVNTIDVLSADQYREAVNENGTAAQIAMLGDASTDWQELIYNNAYSTDNTLSLSGSVKSIPYRVSLGYLNQDGIIKTSNFERGSAALNLSPSLFKDHLKVNLNLRGVTTNSRFADHGVIGSAVAMDPTKPVYDDDKPFGGYYQWTDTEGLFNPNATRNPLSTLEQRRDEGDVMRTIGNLQLDYIFHFLPDLRANLNVGFDVSDSEGSIIQPATYAPVAVQGGSVSNYSQEKTNKLLDFYLNYTKDLPNANSHIGVTAGYSYQDFSVEDPGYPELNLEGDTIRDGRNDLFPQNRLISVFGRVNYTYKGKYLLTATVRRDGSSKFHEDHRIGVFPSLALAWRISDEGFLKNVKPISNLKLRLGYGVTGQQDVGQDFPYLARYGLSDAGARYQFGNTYYYMFRPEAYDPTLKWEESETYNAGLDFGFLEGRVNGSFDYYNRKTTDLLGVVNVAAGTNFSNRILTNVGNIESEGLEAAINVFVVDNEKLSWEVGVTGTFNQNRVTNLSKIKGEDAIVETGGIGGGTGSSVQVHAVGYAPNSYYVYKQVYNENGVPIAGLYEDLNGDNEITVEDRYRYKSPDPKFFLGLSSQINYDKWSLGFVLRGSIDNYVYDNINSQYGNYSVIASPGYLSNLTADVYKTRFKERSTEILRSDYYVKNASFLRMENINLRYDFGNVWSDKFNLQMSASVQNAFTISDYKGLDPEVPGGIDNNFYPRPRIFALGLSVGL